MRINKFVALATGMGRRAADAAIAEGRVLVNGKPPVAGYEASQDDIVTLDGKAIKADVAKATIMLNKPAGYVVSRDGQGSKTIYNLLPAQYHHLKPIGRLDKDSSGLLLLTNDGRLANELAHPSHGKTKVYEVELNKPLTPEHWQKIARQGVQLEDGISKFQLSSREKNSGYKWLVTMHEGRNRQIRRTFAALGYSVTKLHRTQFGDYALGNLTSNAVKNIS